MAMSRCSQAVLAVLFFCVPALAGPEEAARPRAKELTVGADQPAAGQEKPFDATALARRVWTITDLVLEHHVRPPTRQEMLLAGVKALHGIPVVAVDKTPSNPALARQLKALLRNNNL